MIEKTDHDLLVEMHGKVSDLWDGKAGPCAVHSSEIKTLKDQIATIFAREWALLVGVLLALGGAILGIVLKA